VLPAGIGDGSTLERAVPEIWNHSPIALLVSQAGVTVGVGLGVGERCELPPLSSDPPPPQAKRMHAHSNATNGPQRAGILDRCSFVGGTGGGPSIKG
jgi:hypothetical protein